MDPRIEELKKELNELNKKADMIYASAEQTRKYFKWTAIITIAVVVLPLVGLVFAVPSFLSNYAGVLQSIQ